MISNSLPSTCILGNEAPGLYTLVPGLVYTTPTTVLC